MMSRALLSLRERLRASLEHEEGQGMVEYALVLVLVAVVVIVSVTVIGRQTKNMFSNISNGLAN